jgi:hypothetical protein
MATLSDEQQRALRLMAGSPKGCTKAVLMAHGCPIEMLEKLVTAGLAETWTEEIISHHPSRSLWQAGRRKRSIDWMGITEEGAEGYRGMIVMASMPTHRHAAVSRQEHPPGGCRNLEDVAPSSVAPRVRRMRQQAEHGGPARTQLVAQFIHRGLLLDLHGPAP